MKRMVLLLAGTIAMFVGQTRADAVIDWSATAMTVMLKVPALARSPLHDMAYVHIAIYDAVNAIDGKYSVFAVAPSNAAPWASKEAATASAARRVLLTFYASQQPYIDSVYAAALALLPNDSTTTRGAAIGDTVATRFLALRAGDGRDAIITYTWLTPGPGVYQPTPPGAAQYQPLNPWLAQLRPFSSGLTSSQFRAPGPPELTSDVYTKDFNEVKRYGSRDSSFTTAQQREIARFHTENPNVQMARNIRLFAISRGMSLVDNARLFAQLYVTIGDALITGFDCKYFYNNWRPVTAIREADIDGNPLTERDTSWLPLANTPTHPEYVAAHGCALGALAYTLQKFYGTSLVPVTLTSMVTGTQHSFNNINEIVTESVNARVYGGMHFRSSGEDGVAIGREVAAWVARHHFIRLNASPWVLQPAIGLPASLNPDIVFSAVNESICWGIKGTNAQFIRTTDGGTTWSTSVVGGASGLAGSSISAVDANTAYVAMGDPSGHSSGGIFKTTDGGIGWTKQTTAFPASGGQANSIHFFDANNGVCEGNPNGGNWEIYTTTDGGSQWTRIPSSNIPAPGSGDISTGVNFTSFGNRCWFGTYDNAVYRSTDRGMTWSVARNVLGSASLGPFIAFRDSLNGLGCSPYPTFGSGPVNAMARTTDGGITWTLLAGASIPATPSVNYPAAVPGTHAYVMTSTSNLGNQTPTIPGSAYSTDDGLTWTPIDNQPRFQAAFASGRVGWSVGVNDSIYKWDNNLATSVRQSKAIAQNFLLEQNYPNPFNPSTKIAFQIMKAGQVKLKVFDIVGREVATLVDEQLQAGSYEATFNAKGLASGVYLYRLQAGDFVQTKKLVLLK